MRYVFLCVALIGLADVSLRAEASSKSHAKEESPKKADTPTERIKLSRGDFEIRFLKPQSAQSRAIVIFGSGDGGWSYWEERVIQHLGKTCAVVGVDFSKYAESDYDGKILAADFATLVAFARGRTEFSKTVEIPVIYGGWSMGGEQSVPASAIALQQPFKLSGLLLVAPGPRGRYGLRLRDRAGFAPTGDGSFGLVDFASTLKTLKIAQFHARYDLLDTPGWADGLGLNLRRFDLPRGFHDFEGAGPDFLKLMDDAVAWILTAEPPAK